MPDGSDAALWAVAAFFVVHDLDAIRRKEWRVLPGLSRLSDDAGEVLFVWLHLPLTFAMVWSANLGADTVAGQGLALFAILHVAAHIALMWHPRNLFVGVAAWLPIIGAGVSGGLSLGIV